MKKTNKVLFLAYIISLIFMSVYAVTGVMKLKGKIMNTKEVDFNNITCLKVNGRIFIGAYNKKDIRNYNEINWGELKASNLFVKQNKDTLEITRKGNNEGRIFTSFNIEMNNLKRIQVANYALVRVYGASSKDVKLIASGNSGIEFIQGPAIENLEADLSGEARVSIDTCMNANVNLKGGSYLIFNRLKNKIKGVLYNRAFVDLDGDNYNASELVKKDSSAVIYRKSNVNGIVVRRLTY